MIKKASALPGTKIIFDRNPLVFIAGGPKEDVTHIDAHVKGAYALDSIVNNATIKMVNGDIATIKSSPKKIKDGGTRIELTFEEQDIWCFWCDVYYNASVI